MPPRAERHALPAAGQGRWASRRSRSASTSRPTSSPRATCASELARRWVWPIGCVRAGGALSPPFGATAARARLERAIRYAGWAGASIVNTALVNPPTHPTGRARAPGRAGVAGRRSRIASEHDFVQTAERSARGGTAGAGSRGEDRDRSAPGLDRRQFDGDAAPARPGRAGQRRRQSGPGQHLLALRASGGDRRGGHRRAGAARGVLALQEPAADAYPRTAPLVFPARAAAGRRPRLPLCDLGDAGRRYAGYLAVEGAQKGDQLSQDRRSAEYARDCWRSSRPVPPRTGE